MLFLLLCFFFFHIYWARVMQRRIFPALCPVDMSAFLTVVLLLMCVVTNKFHLIRFESCKLCIINIFHCKWLTT